MYILTYQSGGKAHVVVSPDIEKIKSACPDYISDHEIRKVDNCGCVMGIEFVLQKEGIWELHG